MFWSGISLLEFECMALSPHREVTGFVWLGELFFLCSDDPHIKLTAICIQQFTESSYTLCSLAYFFDVLFLALTWTVKLLWQSLYLIHFRDSATNNENIFSTSIYLITQWTVKLLWVFDNVLHHPETQPQTFTTIEQQMIPGSIETFNAEKRARNLNCSLKPKHPLPVQSLDRE